MRYANPAIAPRLAALKDQGCDRILLVPLYPQYAGASTATACDHAFRALMGLRWQPAIRVAPPYFEEPAYIDAIAQSIRSHLASIDFEPEGLVCSFHGMPQSYLELGDPYHCQCQKTSRLVREKLNWPAERWHTTFQSQFGRDPWLQPYTIDTMERLAKSGIKRLAIVSPGFSADCLETLEELDMENRAKFMASGGEKFTYVPCLNDGALGMSVIEQIVRRELAGWV
jgi:protoporphyrin/coproporphyrin ferrochelatase